MIFRTYKLGKVYFPSIKKNPKKKSSPSLSLLRCGCSTRRIRLAAHELWDGVNDFNTNDNSFDDLGATTTFLYFGLR